MFIREARCSSLRARTEILALRRAHDERMDRAVRRRQQLAQRHPATVARRLALTHRIAEEVDAGRYADWLIQRMNLLLPAPDIQEEIGTAGGGGVGSSGRSIAFVWLSLATLRPPPSESD